MKNLEALLDQAIKKLWNKYKYKLTWQTNEEKDKLEKEIIIKLTNHKDKELNQFYLGWWVTIEKNTWKIYFEWILKLTNWHDFNFTTGELIIGGDQDDCNLVFKMDYDNEKQEWSKIYEDYI